ncbi:MAG: tyrosine-protein phosphatase [Desulfobacterales bacterium]|nr:tyrosine-protein phosphatase [Desulfobacterales bacterium]
MSHSIGLKFSRKFLIGVFIIVISVPTAYYLYYSFIIRKFTEVSEGKVYRSAEMPPEKLKSIIKKYDLRTIIDLRRPGRKTKIEQKAVSDAGAQYINIYSKQVPKEETIDAFLDVMSKPESFPVIIHCEHGEGRAPLFSAIYLIEFECWSNEKARQSTDFIMSILEYGNFDLSEKKGKYLNDYKRRLSNCLNTNNNPLTDQ